LADAFAGAASAIVKVLHKPKPPESPGVISKDPTNSFSPMKRASLRREDLKKLKELQDDILTEAEFLLLASKQTST
jgi:hypothetical protein